MIHLDTSFLIRALAPETPEDSKLRSWVAAGETIAISSVCWAELLCGPLSSSDMALARLFVDRCVDFTEDHAAATARLFNDSGRRRGSLADCMIAAVALSDDAPIATSNEADFERFAAAGLTIA